MIEIICSSCQALLTMDDAFAGGVCRCAHCGMIQTVPRAAGRPGGRARVRPQRAAAVAGERAGGADSLGDGSGLEAIEALAASGPSASNVDLQTSSQTAKKDKPPAKRKLRLLAVYLAATILIFGAAVLWLRLR